MHCNSVLYGVPDYHMQKLQCAMNASARFIFCGPKHCHITPLLLQLHWLPIHLWIVFKILQGKSSKVLQGSAPKYLAVLISVLLPSRYNLRQNNTGILLSTLKCFQRVTLGDGSFIAAVPQLWNSLPIHIKTFLFSKAFCLYD